MPRVHVHRATGRRAGGLASALVTLVKRVLTPLGLRPAAGRLAYRGRALWYRRAAGGLPIPPAPLMTLVTGGPNVPGYVRTGQLAAESIRRTLARQGVALESFRAILDFGCGCGRVLRYWRGLPAAIHGVDSHPDLLAWCARHLRFAQFHVNGPEPPLPYAEGTFDLVYALSVFTHLDAAHQQAWIGELGRVTRPGGYILLTTSGVCPVYTGGLPPDEQARLARSELVVRGVGAGPMGSNYVNAYHPVSYVRTTLARDFTVVSVLEGGAWGTGQQDIYLLQRP